MKLVLLCFVFFPFLALAQRNYPPQIEGAERVVFKTAGDVELAMWVFKPGGWKPEDKRPAAVFFFGGGWKGGSPQQFVEQCRYLAGRGMVAATADYRVLGRHGTPAKVCLEDAKASVRFLRAHAEEWGIDPGRVLAGGGSAGGHLAACTGTVKGFEVGEDLGVSSVPDAMALFNPACVLAPFDGDEGLAERADELRERMGVEPEVLSPAHQVKAGAPPTIIFHGKADTTVLYSTAEAFTRVMVEKGNRCELVGFEGKGHGFFNFGKGPDNASFDACMEKLDAFLVSLGWIGR